MTDADATQSAPGPRPVALVTGASRGLGWSLALEAASRGFHVLALGRTVGALEELDDAITAAGGGATLIPLDVSDAEGVERLAQAVAARWGALDLWLHCVSHAPALAPVAHAEPKDLDKAWRLGVAPTQRLIQALAPLLRRAEGAQAVWMDDLRDGAALFSTYAAAKAATRALWTAWAAETRRTGTPRIRRALPPPMATALRSRFYPGEDRTALADRAAVARALFDALPGEADPIDLR
jgi:NAD(P)-dependent dehydrogenase (short-subunit alcohol dehydrogenase family)